MKPTCHICNSDSSFFMNKDGYDLYLCSKCDLVFVYPLPSAESLQKKLYSYESGYQSNRVEDLGVREEYPRFKTVFDYAQKVKPNGKFLDVGCGNGQSIYWANKRGFKAEGIEVNERTAQYAQKQGLKVFNGFLENANLEKDFFDIVFLGELIEHVTNPRDMILQCRTFLNTNGILIITTPNIDCLWSRTTLLLYKIFKIPWSSVTPPYHLHQFNSSNIDLLVESEGFKKETEWYLRIPPLKYEIGMLHLLKRYKNTRKLKDFIFMLFSYAVYVVVHTFFLVIHPLMKRDFQMIKVYRKNI